MDKEYFKLSNCLSDHNIGIFPNVSYNVPGLFLFSSLIYSLQKVVLDKTGYSLPIKYIYGSPPLCRWNNGRLILNTYGNTYTSLNDIEKELCISISQNILPLLTFSNLYIDNKSLKDKKCNDILKILNRIGGGVILSNDMLKQHILEKFPNISIHSSVIITSLTDNRDTFFYDNLSGNYSVYVIHPDDNFNSYILNNIKNKENAEIIVNERCKYACSIRKNHYECISIEQISKSDGKYIDTHFLDKCVSIPEIKQSTVKWRNISLTINELQQIYNLGFRKFKLQGRTDNLYSFFFDLLRYSLNNDVIFPNIFPIFTSFIENFLNKE